VSDDDKEKYLKFGLDSDITKTLGLAWDPATDELLFSLTSLDPGSKACRQSVLATIASFYHIRISSPRFWLLSETDVEINGFCYGSEEAYGAFIYVLSRGTSPSSHLLCSKSHVVPLKTLSVPKLELCGAVRLAKLMNEVIKMDMFNGNFHCWCDTSVAQS